MALKDRLKAAVAALMSEPAVKSVNVAPLPNGLNIETQVGDVMRATTIPVDSPQGQALLAAMATKDPRAVGHVLSGMGIMSSAPPADTRQAQALEAFGHDGAGNYVSWEAWCADREALETNLPGWTACRFYHLVGPDRGVGVFGAVKDPFGIWVQPYYICGDEEETMLPALTHLKSGLALACFESFATALKGVEALEKLDWSVMPQALLAKEDREAWRERSNLVKKMLAFHGITAEFSRHAYDMRDLSDSVIPIYCLGEKGPAAGKPSKRELS